MKSTSFTHVLSTKPQAGPVGGSFFWIKYFQIAQAMNKTFTASIK